MFLKTLNRFRALPESTRAMVFLFWVYEFSQLIVNMFLNLFVFLKTQSMMGLVIYNLVFFAAIFFGFCVWGYVMAQWQISLKLNYLRAFVVYVLSFLILLIFHNDFFVLLLFATLNGLGLGIFWVGVHGYEMLTTDQKNRDFYSSMVSAGAGVLAIFSPLVATLSFYLAEQVLHTETFTLLFWILPFVYLLSLPFIFKLPDFTPPRIPRTEIKRLFLSASLKDIRPYIFIAGVPWGVRAVILPTIMLYSLKTVINIGLFQTVVGILSVLVVIFLSHQRHEGNRLKILSFATLCFSVNFFLLSFWLTSPYVYMLYALVMVLIQPIHRVSQHVIDLHSMELLKEGKNHFYSGMLYRDVLITAARLFGVLLMAFAAAFAGPFWVVQIGIVTIATAHVFEYFAAKWMTRS